MVTATSSGEERSLVGFKVGGVNYALDVHRVREIIKPLEVSPLPHAPRMIVGVFDHRGDVVPVVDLRLRFLVKGRGEPKAERWIIVTGVRGLSGLVVDSVTEVFRTSGPQARDLPRLGAGDEARGISGVHSHNGELVFVVNPDRLTSVTDDLDLTRGESGRGTDDPGYR